MTRPLTVVHVITTLNVGGAEQLLLDICRRMSHHDIASAVVYLKGEGPLEDEFREEGIQTRRVPLKAAVDPTVILPLARAIAGFRPDIVHTHMFKADLHGLVAARRLGVRHIVTTKHAAEQARNLAPVGAVDRWLAERSDAVIAVSRDMAEFTARAEGIRRDLIRVIYSGADLDRLTPSRTRCAVRREVGVGDAPIVLTTARLHPAKGHPVLLRAMRLVRESLPEAILVIAGDGEQRDELVALAEPDGSKVRFLGARRDVADLVAAADCFVMSSLREGLGIALIEAMAYGRACVATRAGAIPEVVTHGVDGLLVEPGDPDALADALLQVLTDEDLRRRLEAAAPAAARERFDVARTTAEYAALYREIAGPDR